MGRVTTALGLFLVEHRKPIDFGGISNYLAEPLSFRNAQKMRKRSRGKYEAR